MEAMEAMASQMATPWRGLEEYTRSHKDAITEFIDSPMDSAAQLLGKQHQEKMLEIFIHDSNDLRQKLNWVATLLPSLCCVELC